MEIKNVYLDNTSTTPLDEEVLNTMKPCFNISCGNASSIHSLGREAKEALEKRCVLTAIGLTPEDARRSLRFSTGKNHNQRNRLHNRKPQKKSPTTEENELIQIK